MSKAIVVRGHHSGGPFTLLGIPGVYENGVPYPLEKTGRSLTEMRRLFAEHPDIDVEFVDVKKTAAKTTQADKSADSAEKEG